MHETPDTNLASLISNGKLADADYGSVLDDKQANDYDLRTTTIKSGPEACAQRRTKNGL